MEPTSSPDSSGANPSEQTLLGVARDSIACGLREGRALAVDPERFPAELRIVRATFVTLRLEGELRGCTGTLEARDPLVVEVAHTAYRTAFCDPRFPALEAAEFPELEIRISILGPLEPLPAESELELLARLRPGIDGLLLQEGSLSSTFLPAVWRELPSPREFLAHLKRKAGLPADHWSATLAFQRYTVEEIP